MEIKIKHLTRLSGIPQRTPGTGDSYPGINETGFPNGNTWKIPEGWNQTPSPQTDSYMSRVPSTMSGNSEGKRTDSQALEQVKNIKHMTAEEFELFKQKIENEKQKGLMPLVADEYVYRLVRRAQNWN